MFHPWVGKIPWRRKWQSTPVVLPGESHGWRSLVGYSPRGRKESDTTERLHLHLLPPAGWGSPVGCVYRVAQKRLSSSSLSFGKITFMFSFSVSAKWRDWISGCAKYVPSTPVFTSTSLEPFLVEKCFFSAFCYFVRQIQRLLKEWRKTGGNNSTCNMLNNKQIPYWSPFHSRAIIFLE